MKISKMIELYNKLSRLPEEIYLIRNVVTGIAEFVYRDKAKEKHFVLVLFEAERIITVTENSYPRSNFELSPEIKKVERCTAADSKYVTDGHDGLFSFQPFFPIRKVRITVICDVSKIKIDMMRAANVDLSPTYENAPMAFYDGTVQPSNRIAIQVSPR